MRAHIVCAHPEPRSYNAHLAATARRALERRGWSVTVSDLYADGVRPVRAGLALPRPADPSRFDVQAEQRHASQAGRLPADVAAEIARLDQADLLILQYPMWWHLPPAMLKGWFDRVLAYGEVYTSRKRFEHGRFAGRRAMLSVTVGTSEATYAHDGRSGDVDLLLWPVHFTLAYVGYTVLAPVRGLRRRGRPALLGPADRGGAPGRTRPRAGPPRWRSSRTCRPSPSTPWRTGARTAASSRRLRSIRRSSAASSACRWSDRTTFLTLATRPAA